MATVVIAKLKEDIKEGSFDCGNASINSLVNNSYYSTILQHAYCYGVSVDGNVVGYYMLKFMKIILDDCPENISDYKSDICEDCFSIHIKYIAVGKNFQKHGIGTMILKYIIKSVLQLCENWPIRLLTLDALKEKFDWYESVGFIPFNEKDLENDEPTIKMYIDCLLDDDIVNNYIEELVT